MVLHLEIFFGEEAQLSGNAAMEVFLLKRVVERLATRDKGEGEEGQVLDAEVL